MPASAGNKALLVSLLPQVIHLRGEDRLSTLVEMINDETRHEPTAREIVLARLLEVLLIESLRSTGGTAGPHGFCAAGPIHKWRRDCVAYTGDPSRAMSVENLAEDAAMSRECRRIGEAPDDARMSANLPARSLTA